MITALQKTHSPTPTAPEVQPQLESARIGAALEQAQERIERSYAADLIELDNCQDVLEGAVE